MSAGFAVFGGTANPRLAEAVAREMRVPLGACETERFPDGELTVRLEESVRAKEVFVVQPTSPPVNEHLVELLAFADAARRSAAGRITAVVPYFGYARADRRNQRREPITASLVAQLVQVAGIAHVVTVDPHTPQIEGFFSIPVDSLSAVCALAAELRGRLPPDTVVVSPDTGRVKLATEYARELDAQLAVLHKRRQSGSDTEVTQLAGEVEGRPCLLVDDMVSTGGTLVGSVRALRDAGATEFRVAATHGLFLDGALARLAAEGVAEVLVTDTVPTPPATEAPPVRVASVAPALADVIRKLLYGTRGPGGR
ncbi:MAG TPA: ribose-phosphate pyrophosphokinase [Longimicrobiaceae bacterium]|nr:ribose-phosphate pyrophosphokinase [Longimicrobiaceae bacterium]